MTFGPVTGREQGEIVAPVMNGANAAPSFAHRSWQPPGDPRSDAPPLDLRRVLLGLRRRWWLIALVMIATLGAAWAWVRTLPQRYIAGAVVQLVDTRQQLAGGLVSGRAEDGGLSVSIFSQMELLRSRAVASQVVDSVVLGLRVRAQDFPASVLKDVEVDDDETSGIVPLVFTPTGVVVDSLALVPYGEVLDARGVRLVVTERPADRATGTLSVLTREEAVDRAIRSLRVEPREMTTLFDVEYITDDPELARRAVNAWVKTYQDVDARRAREQTLRRRAFIEQQLRETDAQLAEAERALSRFRTEQRAYSSQQKFQAQRTELAQLDVQRQNFDAERRLAGGLLRDIESGGPEVRRRALNMLASSEVGATPVVSRLYDQLVEYESRRTELTSGPSGKSATNPEVQRLDTLVTSTRSQLTDAVRAHIALLDARVASLDEQRRSGNASLSGVALVEAEETRLSQNAEVLRVQAEALRTSYQQVRIADAAAVGQVEIVDLARRAASLDVPRGRVLAFAAALGLVLGGLVAVLREAFDHSVRNREMLEAGLGLPLLATIPPIDQSAGGPQHARLLLSPVFRKADGERRRSVALAARAVRAPSSEAFRQLRTNLSFLGGTMPPRTIVVTSALEGEGKTSVAVNLAISFAQQQFRVLLVDCDLLASGIHRVFKLPPGPGLQQLIMGHSTPCDAVRPTPVPGLDVITAGTRVGESDAIGSPVMRRVLRHLAPEYDVIILDSPPVLAVSDSLVLSVAAEGVVFVMRAGGTKVTDAKEALRHLVAAGAQVAGGVLNDPDGRVETHGGRYYGYGSSYYKGAAAQEA